jgi:hypothetical protein
MASSLDISISDDKLGCPDDNLDDKTSTKAPVKPPIKIELVQWLRDALESGDIRIDRDDTLGTSRAWVEVRYLRTCTPNTCLRELSIYVREVEADAKRKTTGLRLVDETGASITIYSPEHHIEWQ